MILQLYVLRQVLTTGAFALVLTSLTLYLLLGFQSLHRYEGVGLEYMVLAAPYLMLYIVSYTLPAAVLLGILFPIGRLAGEREFVAVQGGAISVWAVLRPVAWTASVVACAALFLYGDWVPAGFVAQREAFKSIVDRYLTAPPPGPRSLSTGAVRLHYRRADGPYFEDVMVVVLDDKLELSEQFLARRCRAERSRDGATTLLLESVDHVRIPADRPDDLQVLRATEVRYTVLPKPEDPESRRLEELPFETLRDARGKIGRYPVQRLRAQWHARLASAYAVVPLALLGLGLGLRVRPSNRLAGFGTALPPLLGHYGLGFLGQSAAERGLVSPALGAWAAPALLTILGIVVLYWALRR